MPTYIPSPRISGLRERVMEAPHARNLGAWRDYYYLEGWSLRQGVSLAERNAAALAHVIRNMPVHTADDDLLAGEHGNDHAMVNFRSRCGSEVVDGARAAGLPQEHLERMEQWLAANPFLFQELAPVPDWPHALRIAHDRGAVQIWGSDLNHSIRDYAKVLRLGFRGIRGEIDQAVVGLQPDDPGAPSRLANLNAFGVLCDACAEMGMRHAADLRERGLLGDADLLEGCEQVPAGPARTFRQAVQSLWFAHMVTVWEDGVNANGIGRIDQILWPYLQADLADGAITMDQASELLAALWVKLYEPYDVQQMMVGGQLPDGSDATNPMSYLALDVTEGMDFVRCLSARVHNASPREFVCRCVDLVAHGGGIPFFFNDEALVPALTNRGIPVEDARGYAAIGCIEITLPGMANPHAVSNWVNLPKLLELAINGGRDPRDGVMVGTPCPGLLEWKGIEDAHAALDAQLAYFARWCAFGSNRAEVAHRSQYRLPYLSLLTADCISRGMDIIEGGARYNYHSTAAMGIPNAADSLAALDAAVFRTGRVSPAEMHQALLDDFVGHEELQGYLRQRLPQYGNDRQEVDAIAADLVRRYVDEMDKLRTVSGGRFFTHLFTFTMMLPMGKAVGATPDGRRSGEPLAYSVSPGQGRDRSGLTAVVRSLATLPHHMVAAASSAILEADPTMLEGPGRQAFVDLLVTAIALGVGQMQFNVVDAETLRRAQQEPDRYRNLCVRVSGFSQQFGLLDREMQDHIIARTKHKV